MATYLKPWKFKVKAPTRRNEIVCVTGSCSSLGLWAVNKVFRLTQETDLWSGTIGIPNDDIYYRYCLCRFDKLNDKTMVLKWESFQNPRVIKKNSKPDEHYDTFGNRNIEVNKVLNFCEEDAFQVNHLGWLTTDQIIQLDIQYDAIIMKQEDFSFENVFLKVTALARTKKQNIFRDLDVDILIHEHENKFRPQDQYGYKYNKYHSVIFMSRIFLHEYAEFTVHLIRSDDESYEDFGYCSLILNNPFRQSIEYLNLPIHDEKGEVIGELLIHIVITNPFEDLNFNFERSYCRLWKKTWSCLHIGHRGAGSTVTMQAKFPDYVENTIGAVTLGKEQNVDMVEIDVHVTRDLIPILNHNFELLLTLSDQEDHPVTRISTQEITYDELETVKEWSVSDENTFKSFIDTSELYRPFQTLEKLLVNIEEDLPMILEIKYPLELNSGAFECQVITDMNTFLDTILRIIFAKCGSRFIIFASFSREVTFMMRMKQNKYPVIGLTKHDETHTRYKDKIAHCIPSTINFINSVNLLGIGVHASTFQKNYEVVLELLRKRVIIFSWGLENDMNSKTLMKKYGVHGIILDAIPKERISCGCKLSEERFP